MSRRSTPPSFISLRWSDFDRQERRREQIRFWAGCAAFIALSCLVSWVTVGAFVGGLP